MAGLERLVQISALDRVQPSLSLILQELATNASKYGALSVESRHVDVTWSTIPVDSDTPELFEFRWSEVAGPPVSKPERRSFGTRLIEMGLGGGPSASSALDYHPSGVQCRVIAPLAELQADE